MKNNYGCSGGYMSYLFDFLKQNGTITGGEYESDEVIYIPSLWDKFYFLM